MKVTATFIVVFAWFILFTFLPLPSVMMFTPLLIIFIPRLQKREVFLIFILQLVDDYLFYFRSREHFVGMMNIASFILIGRINVLNYDRIVLVTIALQLLLIYALSYCFLKLTRLKRRIHS